jgi:hypothetical protein
MSRQHRQSECLGLGELQIRSLRWRQDEIAYAVTRAMPGAREQALPTAIGVQLVRFV